MDQRSIIPSSLWLNSGRTVGLYLDPPERTLALCVDEKSLIQAHLLASALGQSMQILPRSALRVNGDPIHSVFWLAAKLLAAPGLDGW